MVQTLLRLQARRYETMFSIAVLMLQRTQFSGQVCMVS